MAISNQLFYSLRRSSLVSHRISSPLLRIIRSLNVAAAPATRRGIRGEKSVEVSRAQSTFLYSGLANARSLVSNRHLFNYHLTLTGLDLLAVTETWLNHDNGEVTLRDVCPASYSAINCPRSVRRGRGVALIFRDTSPASFEYLSASLSLNGTTICLVVIYRSPLHISQFMTEFPYILELLLPTPSKLLSLGTSTSMSTQSLTRLSIVHLLS